MPKPSVKCALLAAMIAKHRWGTPIDEDHLLAIAAIEPNGVPIGREQFERLRYEPYITSRGNRGIQLDTSAFGRLADVLYDECEWEPNQIKSRLKHYEGWADHDWVESSAPLPPVRHPTDWLLEAPYVIQRLLPVVGPT